MLGHGGALLRGLRDVGREVDGRRRDRAAVLRRAARRPRPGRGRVAAAPAVAGGLAGDEGALRGDLQVEDTGRMDGHLRRERRLRGTRACRHGRRTSTRTTWPARPSSRSTAPCNRRRRPASPRRRPSYRGRRRHRARTPCRVSSSGASTRASWPSSANRERSARTRARRRAPCGALLSICPSAHLPICPSAHGARVRDRGSSLRHR